MAKILVIYASMTGSTELMAEAMVDHIHDLGHDVDKRSFDFEPLDSAEDMLGYDGILIGSYTWDDDLPYEVEDFYDELENVDLSGKLIGVFGSCDSFYPVYGAALDTISTRVSERGASIYGEKLKIELEPDKKDIEACKQFAEGMLKQLAQ
ncbi:flavodoxin [Virgibacillus siamensis]|uniref:flavodoxin n=1 Tax=Virgibacillus siamensis TaxID=480071 RepID=UPI000984E856|nr:flavodoxin [Virgibacillus siamensis]